MKSKNVIVHGKAENIIINDRIVLVYLILFELSIY